MSKQSKPATKNEQKKNETEFANEIAAFSKETKQPMNGYDMTSAR